MNNNREIMTTSGKMFDFWLPDSKQIDIEDIAHALALTNRYGGHTRVPYSVAEHCVRMTYPGMPGDPLVNLLHDAAEAYIGDVPSPIKHCMFFSIGMTHDCPLYSFQDIEFSILATIGQALGLPKIITGVMPKETHRADLIMLATEVRDLMPVQWQYEFVDLLKGITTRPERIEPWGWAEAEEQFYQRFKELRDAYAETQQPKTPTN